MWHYGIANDWQKIYLQKHLQFVESDYVKSSLTEITSGVPQGSTPSPKFFTIHLNDLPNDTENFPRLVADDTCLFLSSPTLEELKIQRNNEVTKVSE